MINRVFDLQVFARTPNVNQYDFTKDVLGVNVGGEDLKWYTGYDFGGAFGQFPPVPYDLCKYGEYSAWYGGDTRDIQRQWGTTSEAKGNNAFWSSDRKENGVVKMHIPLAGDMAQTSADLLFSDFPDMSIPEADSTSDDEGNILEGDKRAIQAFERLRDIIAQGDVHSKLLEAGEVCAAMGGVFIKVVWNKDMADFPLMDIIQPDCAIPEFKYGILTAVTFWQVIKTEEVVRADTGVTENKIYRLLERHEVGRIYNAIYKGTATDIGEPVPFEEFPAYSNLNYVENTGCDQLLVRYIPNIKPNRLVRGSNLGQSDFAGLSPIFDAIDETYSSLMRDIRIARSRILVPESMLDYEEDKRHGGVKATFNNDLAVIPYASEILSAIEGGDQTIQHIQPSIRVEEHINTILDLIERAVIHAGYSPQTFGLKLEGAESGSALNIRERKTYITRQRKWKYWESSLEDLFQLMLFVDNTCLGNGTPYDFRPSLQLNDSCSRDASALGDVLEKLNNAQAVSTDTKVRMLHPDWEEKQVQAEVKLIMEEYAIGTDTSDADVLDDTINEFKDNTGRGTEEPDNEDDENADDEQ